LRAPMEPKSFYYGAALAFLGGPINASLLVFLLPVCERLFNVTTDIRLLELSNLNLPVVRELMVKAPSTYNHSVAVGILAEGAAKAIGRNPLFMRVAALYHDIGKIAHPEAFIENQQGSDIHNTLTPEESVELLREHVTAGARIAKAAKTPSNLIEIIAQHHGTRLIHSFYTKAQKRAANEEEILEDDNYRYPGPKPQTKDAAIIMIADSVEAATRAAKDHSAEHLLQVIQKLISLMAEDGQFSECDITLGELDRIAFSFLDTLANIYHSRIDYPGLGMERKSKTAPLVASR
jgi:cyclic-di-AMP phosphodiesterase PgpH